MRAKGAQRESAHARPTRPTKAVAAWVVVMKNVRNIQSAKRTCERSQARRRVSQGIWQAERRREKREWSFGEGLGGKKDVMDAERVPGVPGVEGRRFSGGGDDGGGG